MAIVGKFAFAIASGACSHIGAFNTLYQVRAQISRHIAKVNLGFFDQTTSGALKKVIIEDVERIEKFLAHQIPDIVAAACTPAIMFCYLLTLNVPMALGMLVPVVLGVAVQLFAMAATGKQMPTYHRLLAKLNAAIMQFINGMPVMKAYRLDAKGYREYADAVTEYNEFWKQCTKSQGYSYGVFVAIVESGILFVLPLGGVLYLQGSLSAADYLFFMIMSMVFLSNLLNLLTFAMTFNPDHERHGAHTGHHGPARGLPKARSRSIRRNRTRWRSITSRSATAPPRPTRSPTSASICPPAA